MRFCATSTYGLISYFPILSWSKLLLFQTRIINCLEHHIAMLHIVLNFGILHSPICDMHIINVHSLTWHGNHHCNKTTTELRNYFKQNERYCKQSVPYLDTKYSGYLLSRDIWASTFYNALNVSFSLYLSCLRKCVLPHIPKHECLILLPYDGSEQFCQQVHSNTDGHFLKNDHTKEINMVCNFYAVEF